MYSYYSFKTDCLSNTWETVEIENYLCSFSIFIEKGNGTFTSQNPFLSISLMKVKDWDSWSGLDYDKDETNYVAIVTSSKDYHDTNVKTLLKGLEQLLNSRICPDW